MAWFDEPRTKVPGDVQVAGQLPSGDYKTLQLDANGNLKTTGGGGGGGGDASAANQLTQIAQIGEVQASPTANTVLDRLKTLATLLAGGLPAALTAGGGLKAGLIDAIPAGENQIGKVGSAGVVVGVEFTRPSDTTAYTAKDVVCNSTSAPAVITFSNFSRINNSTGIIVKARLFTDQLTNTAQFRLHLFHTAPTAINDNSPYLLLYTNATNRIGMIDFPAMATEDGTNSTAASSMRPSSDGSYSTPNLWFQTASASRTIYGVLETLSAFTPASGQKFYIELSAVND